MDVGTGDPGGCGQAALVGKGLGQGISAERTCSPSSAVWLWVAERRW